MSEPDRIALVVPIEPAGTPQRRRLGAVRAMLTAARGHLERARAAAEALALVGLPAAVLAADGRPLVINGPLAALTPGVLRQNKERLLLAHKPSDTLFAVALRRLADPSETEMISIPVPARGEHPPLILHLVPNCSRRSDLFAAACGLLIAIPVVPQNIPSTALLQGLFDFSPAEARVARAVGECKTVEVIAERFDLSRETVRSQLKSVLAKTGLSRQADLAALLAGTALPTRPR